MLSNKNKHATCGRYVLLKPLGSGYNSKVKLGLDPEKNQSFAVKMIKHSHPSLNLKTLKKEIEMLSQLSHPNIVNLIEFQESADYVKKNGTSYKVVMIVMELVPNGEVFEYVADTGRFSEEVARYYFQVLITTLEYCHNQGITHRDLKPENLLFDAKFNMKIADFGFATLLCGKDGSGELHTVLGTESYMAPEIHARQPYNGVAVDLFAAAIILFIFISGTPPFAKADPKADPHYKLLCTGKADVFWKAHERNKPKRADGSNFYSLEFKDMITAMLALDAGSRPTIEQLKGHSWFLGDTPTFEQVQGEFLKRKKLVDEEMAKQRAAKEQQKMAAQTTSFAMGGIKPMRSILTQEQAQDFFNPDFRDEKIAKHFENKVDFTKKREMNDFAGEVMPRTHILSIFPANFMFQHLCASAASHLKDVEISEDTYKIRASYTDDEGRCGLTINIYKYDEKTCCVEFLKKNGEAVQFQKAVAEVKKDLPEIASA